MSGSGRKDPAAAGDDAPFVHSKALVETELDRIGAGTRIWAFAHVMKDVTIGSNCNIAGHVFVESGVTLGDEVTVKNMVMVCAHVHLGDRVFVGPGAAFTNDRFPRSREKDWKAEATSVEEGATIGSNATIRCGIRIGRFAFVGAGAVVTRDVAPHEIVTGNPAVRAGWACACARPLRPGSEGRARCAHCGRAWRVQTSGVREEVE